MSAAQDVGSVAGSVGRVRGARALPPGAVRIPSPRARAIERAVLLVITVVPAIGAVVGVWLLVSGRLGAAQHAIFAGMYLFTGFGITLGYHRLLAHRAFRTGRVLRGVLAVAGAMAIQGPVMRWVADHRRHHGWTDREGDPHSPHVVQRAAGGGAESALQPDAGSQRDVCVQRDAGAPPARSTARGLWHAHIGWFFAEEKTAVRRFAADLVRDLIIVAIDRLYPLWMLLSLAIPTALGLAIEGPTGAWQALAWGGLTRVFVVQHVTWSINSIGHSFGPRPFSTDDASRNCWLLGWLALGEGWHNNHHAFPRAAVHGFRRHEIDPSGVVLRALERAGLAWDLRRPPAAAASTGKKG
ncbi:MAG TPA: acyl-CoA desaturase [Candidatus Binatia bacterium]